MNLLELDLQVLNPPIMGGLGRRRAVNGSLFLKPMPKRWLRAGLPLGEVLQHLAVDLGGRIAQIMVNDLIATDLDVVVEITANLFILHFRDKIILIYSCENRGSMTL